MGVARDFTRDEGWLARDEGQKSPLMRTLIIKVVKIEGFKQKGQQKNWGGERKKKVRSKKKIDVVLRVFFPLTLLHPPKSVRCLVTSLWKCVKRARPCF